MGKKHRRIPYGTMNWELIVRECHFVDNTAYIRELENCRSPFFYGRSASESPWSARCSRTTTTLFVEFEYFTKAEADRLGILGRTAPDAETVEQAVRYRASLVKRPGWVAPVETAVVEVCGNIGYNWHPIA